MTAPVAPLPGRQAAETTYRCGPHHLPPSLRARAVRADRRKARDSIRRACTALGVRTR